MNQTQMNQSFMSGTWLDGEDNVVGMAIDQLATLHDPMAKYCMVIEWAHFKQCFFNAKDCYVELKRKMPADPFSDDANHGDSVRSCNWSLGTIGVMLSGAGDDLREESFYGI